MGGRGLAPPLGGGARQPRRCQHARQHGDRQRKKGRKNAHLRQQLHQCALHLPVGAGALAEPPPADRVDLIHEDDAGLVVARVAAGRGGGGGQERGRGGREGRRAEGSAARCPGRAARLVLPPAARTQTSPGSREHSPRCTCPPHQRRRPAAGGWPVAALVSSRDRPPGAQLTTRFVGFSCSRQAKAGKKERKKKESRAPSGSWRRC